MRLGILAACVNLKKKRVLNVGMHILLYPITCSEDKFCCFFFKYLTDKVDRIEEEHYV